MDWSRVGDLLAIVSNEYGDPLNDEESINENAIIQDMISTYLGPPPSQDERLRDLATIHNKIRQFLHETRQRNKKQKLQTCSSR